MNFPIEKIIGFHEQALPGVLGTNSVVHQTSQLTFIRDLDELSKRIESSIREQLLDEKNDAHNKEILQKSVEYKILNYKKLHQTILAKLDTFNPEDPSLEKKLQLLFKMAIVWGNFTKKENQVIDQSLMVQLTEMISYMDFQQEQVDRFLQNVSLCHTQQMLQDDLTTAFMKQDLSYVDFLLCKYIVVRKDFASLQELNQCFGEDLIYPKMIKLLLERSIEEINTVQNSHEHLSTPLCSNDSVPGEEVANLRLDKNKNPSPQVLETDLTQINRLTFVHELEELSKHVECSIKQAYLESGSHDGKSQNVVLEAIEYQLSVYKKVHQSILAKFQALNLDDSTSEEKLRSLFKMAVVMSDLAKEQRQCIDLSFIAQFNDMAISMDLQEKQLSSLLQDMGHSQNQMLQEDLITASIRRDLVAIDFLLLKYIVVKEDFAALMEFGKWFGHQLIYSKVISLLLKRNMAKTAINLAHHHYQNKFSVTQLLLPFSNYLGNNDFIGAEMFFSSTEGQFSQRNNLLLASVDSIDDWSGEKMTCDLCPGDIKIHFEGSYIYLNFNDLSRVLTPTILLTFSCGYIDLNGFSEISAYFNDHKILIECQSWTREVLVTIPLYPHLQDNPLIQNELFLFSPIIGARMLKTLSLCLVSKYLGTL